MGIHWSRRFAAVADGITAVRALLVPPLFFTVTADVIDVAAGLLAVARWTDFLDGRLARLTPTRTRLGPAHFGVVVCEIQPICSVSRVGQTLFYTD